MAQTESTSLKEEEDKQPKSAADKYPIRFDISDFQYNFDPLGLTFDTLKNCELIYKLNIPTGITQDIVGYIGYIESKLSNIASCPYTNCVGDCEMCFLLSLPYKSPFDYKYTLKSFKCHLKGRENSKICFKILTFYTNKDNQTNKLIELYNSGEIALNDTSEKALPDEYQEPQEGEDQDDDSYRFWWKLCGEIIEFNGLNVKLSNNNIYVLRVDVIEGYVGCAELRQPVEYLNPYINPFIN